MGAVVTRRKVPGTTRKGRAPKFEAQYRVAVLDANGRPQLEHRRLNRYSADLYYRELVQQAERGMYPTGWSVIMEAM